MTKVSSTNNTHSDTQFILRGRSFVYIMKNRGPSINPWELHVPLSEKILSSIKWFYLNFISALSQTGPEPIFEYYLNYTEM
jgi:hypothetical protein